ncbi:MAG: SURF1 family protein [Gammaproteobacteria bacterium]|nr:SURF1 family protein [Gammaproteobacteria bacterium]
MNKKAPLPSWLPLLVGSALVLQFAGLGAWQISRGLEKRATQQAYKAESDFAEWQHGDAIRPFQRLRADGRYDAERQIVLDNIIINSRYGHYVLTPLDIGDDLPLLLVNRGWIEKDSAGPDSLELELPATGVTVRGRAGSLPKAGYKMGDAFPLSDTWPKHAVYPSQTEVEAVLGRPVQDFVLLMDHDEQHGYLRHWVPAEFGPGKHFGYALQWFAMGAVLMGLLIWNYRKKRF